MKKIRFAVAQLDPTVGDYPGNAGKILARIREAEKNGADLVVFPEMALCGYPVWDLANKKIFVREGLKHLDRIRRATAGLKVTAVLGFVGEGPRPGGRSRNSMVWISRGRIVGTYDKRLLPTYDVFLEDIFFEPGRKSPLIAWQGMRVGPTICEDIWDENYAEKPLAGLARKGADWVLNISASPYYRGVAQTREKLVRMQAARYRRAILYVNQVGGQDDLIFDGRSFFCDSRGEVLFRAPAFREGLYYFDWDPEEKSRPQVPGDPDAGTAAEVYQALLLGIRDYCAKNHFKRVVIGLSGGIDSALVAALAADALGPGAVMGIAMPGPYSSKGSWEDARTLARNLGIEFHVHPIRGKYQALLGAYWRQKRKAGKPVPAGRITLAMENLQARVRGLELMFLSNDEGRLVLTTGNKSELAMGYCTLYGDMAGGLAVIGDVYKTEVYRLARYRNSLGAVIPENSLSKPPSAELRPGQKDEDSLPPYEILDRILYLYIEKNYGRDEIVEEMKRSREKIKTSVRGGLARVVARVIRCVDHNEYKRRQTPPILRVSQKAWFGRRMPITNLFDA